MKKIDSVCTYCGVGCDIVGHIEENRVVKISASPDGYVSQGKLCIKGKFGYDFLYDSNRIRSPRVRKSFIEQNPQIAEVIQDGLRDLDEVWYECDLDSATTAATMKIKQIQAKHGHKSVCSIGGARTSCESAYLFQKFTRKTLKTPNIDNCARVCHAPSLKGMRTTIGEGAATNPYNDIYQTEYILVIGSNTTEAHPIVANRMIEAARKSNNLAVVDVREIKLMKYAKQQVVLPHESNLLFLNMMARVIIEEELYNREFIASRTKWFDEFKQKILDDPYADPKFFESVAGFEHLAKIIPNIAREYALKKSMIFWGLGMTEHTDGSYAVMAIVHLALLTGNIGKSGAGLMPLRGQNNVQGACDMGCLPYFEPDYQEPQEKGLATPLLIDAMLDGKIKALFNMGEDITHIHPNLNKIDRAFEELEFLMVQEIMMTDIAHRADIVVGVKSAYEKTGVYVNAMRRLHLSQPLINSDLPDDWEVIQMLDNKMGGEYNYQNSKEVWDEVREVAHRRYSGASYTKLERHRKRGLQWPVYHEDTPVLHLLDFRKDDGLGEFHYHQYKLRGMVEELIGELKVQGGFYLTTGRTLAHYNNAAQTKASKKLNDAYSEDIVLVSSEDADFFTSTKVILRSEHGETTPLTIKITDKIIKGTIFTTFHHARSKINALFGDKRDELILTAAFKSVKVDIVLV